MRTDTLPRGPLLIVAGVVLLVLGVALAVNTERSLVSYQAALQQHGGAVLDLGADAEPNADLQGKTVRISGTPRVVESPYDADFNQQAATPVLTRHVQMFQWHELRLGGSVTYELDWADTPQDSSRFAQPAGHANPGPFPIAGKRFDAGRVELDGYRLDPALVDALPSSEPVAPNIKSLPSNLAASFALHDDALVTSSTPAAPRLGDLRISWSAVPLQEVTVIARVDGDRLVVPPETADGKGYEVDVGNSALVDMRPDMAERPAMVWLRRVFAVLLAALGAGLLLGRGAARIDAASALGGSLLAVGVLAAIPWLGSGTLPVVVWLVIALLGFGLLLWRRRARHR
ncbi:TMEM43 family protein [Rhodanobacter sp. DHG33]|uniref:TMEM43 family protein n=1 Tax=Rhodanobacter sp. DHG33 TaxID=2775921 RepID=UPI00177D017C|nr:TMEM43 family protein [Rhodanobacter sp. DHG33]MBD8897701.1 hypothetical protein [Rhodanobacter sp. DHG33]